MTLELEAEKSMLGEAVWTGRHSSGVELLLNPRPGFVRTHVHWSVRFGSLDQTLRGGGALTLPAGTAHFLEHQLFQDEEEGDLSLLLAQRGASSNASTDWLRTTYELGCSHDLGGNLSLLAHRLFHPRFQDEAVRREREIIAREWAMGEDDPGWREFREALSLLYPGHAVGTDVVGTPESLRDIDARVLGRAHAHYYRPGNTVLVVSGGFSLEEVELVLDEHLGAAVGVALPPRSAEAMPARLPPGRHTLELAVSRPRVFAAWRDAVGDEDATAELRRRLVSRLLLDSLFSTSAPVHMDLYDRDVVDDSFHASYTGEAGFGFTVLGGETEAADRFLEEMEQVFARVREDGVPRAQFEHCRKLGRSLYVRSLDGVGSTTAALTASALAGVRPKDWLELWNDLRPEELDDCARRHLHPDHLQVVELHPVPENGAR